MRTSLTLLATASVVAAVAGAWGWNQYVAGTWASSAVTVQVAPDLDAAGRLDALEEAWEDTPGERVLRHVVWRGWDGRLKAGQYTFSPEESVQTSAERLVTGDRDVVDVVVPSGRDVGPIAGAVSRRVFADSTEVADWFSRDSVMWRVLPNTYEMWWDTDAEGVTARMLREHETWWNEDRIAAAAAQGLTPKEATVLASIVQAETAVIAEAPLVAGLYLNRLKKGMLLQADPTLIFALGDPSIRRVLDVHKDVDSPYNTYKHKGLPPGP
ncbi:MAG: endolytic transglycosylase MltG, partial [Flavobacteriales bacterium]